MAPKSKSDKDINTVNEKNDSTDGTIGSLNGKWSFLFKCGTILVPILATLMGAQVAANNSMSNSINDLDHRVVSIESSRFTHADAATLKEDIAILKEQIKRLPEIEKKIDKLLESKQ